MPVTPVKGWRAKVYAAIPSGTSWKEIPYVENASLEIDSNVDAFLVVGSKNPIISEGARILTGTLSQAWISNDMIKPLYTGDIFDIYVKREIISGGYGYIITAYDCKTEGFSLGLPSDDFIVHDFSFKAEYWSYRTLLPPIPGGDFNDIDFVMEDFI